MAQNSVALDGGKVRTKRMALLLSQEELAERVGVHQNTLSSIESDPDYRTSFRTTRKLAEKLGCEPADLYPQVEEVAS